MFDHFGRRLQRDLKHIVDTRIQTSEALSGGLMRVSRFLLASALASPLTSSLTHSPPESTSTSFRTKSSATPSGSEDRFSLRRPSSTATATPRLTMMRSDPVWSGGSPSSARLPTRLAPGVCAVAERGESGGKPWGQGSEERTLCGIKGLET